MLYEIDLWYAHFIHSTLYHDYAEARMALLYNQKPSSTNYEILKYYIHNIISLEKGMRRSFWIMIMVVSSVCDGIMVWCMWLLHSWRYNGRSSITVLSSCNVGCPAALLPCCSLVQRVQRSKAPALFMDDVIILDVALHANSNINGQSETGGRLSQSQSQRRLGQANPFHLLE